MVSHNIVTCAGSQRPASSSPKGHSLLREELGFNGLIFTADLSMKAIAQYAGDSPAVEAGNDLLLTSDLPRDYAALLKAVPSGRLQAARLEESLARVLKRIRDYRLWTE